MTKEDQGGYWGYVERPTLNELLEPLATLCKTLIHYQCDICAQRASLSVSPSSLYLRSAILEVHDLHQTFPYLTNKPKQMG
jgi:hypothetical protein